MFLQASNLPASFRKFIMMDKVNQLIAYLLAIQSFAGDIHYSCYGEAFYSKHLLADRVADGIAEKLDEIKEVYFLGNNLTPLMSSEYLKMASILTPERLENDDKANFDALKNLLIQALSLIEEMTDFTRGEQSLIDDIARDLQHKLGLINQQINYEK